MIWDQAPTLSPSDVESILKQNAKDLGAPGLDDVFGYGRIQLLASLQDTGTALPSAAIGAYPESGALPLAVGFRDLSTGVPTSWLWDFGDGNTSTQQNPVHTYTVADAYSVSLTVANALGQDQTTRVDYILADVIPPVADFTAAPTAGLAPLAVDFTDQSTGGTPTSWLWDFGDGGTSTLPDPAHTYLTSGFYTVTLTLTNAYGMSQRVQTDLIAVDFIPPVADFSGTPTSGASPLVVQFTDESGGGVTTSWDWFFGDGGVSSAQHPSHTYTAAGTYSVRLRATNAYGTDELWRTNYISVGAGPPLIANFSGTPTSGSAPLTVSFTDLSIGNITAWEWNFGEGTTSTLQNPVHTFTSPGEYDIALEVSNATGSDDQLGVAEVRGRPVARRRAYLLQRTGAPSRWPGAPIHWNAYALPPAALGVSSSASTDRARPRRGSASACAVRTRSRTC